ncbi:MAG TPA: hypothetical protein VF131_24660 [Blastocatellia bacterium]|nr:hypothetical protein [Blastocatellia bacterium]
MKSDEAMIRRTLGVMFDPGDVVEIRIPNAGRYGTVAGYFNDFEKLVKDALRWSGAAPGVYITMNPVRPALLARASNRCREWVKRTTADDEVARRNWFLIDFDARRPTGISSTESEHDVAIAVARECQEWLSSLGWPEGILADSGNGSHLLYKVNLPNTVRTASGLAEGLTALRWQFDDNYVSVDPTVYNAARIIRLYGTLTAKGDSTEERPHRISRLLSIPEHIKAVDPALLKELASMSPTKEATIR